MLNKIKLLKWSSRKLKVPFWGNGLVLDVGSGGNPHPFADVLLEKYIDNEHRYSSLQIDRPIVLGDANRMPFRDKTFSYSLAYHVLEHIETPNTFLGELQRVSSSGYIETPNAFYELIHPFNVHCLSIIEIGGKLLIKKKSSAQGGEGFISELDLLQEKTPWRNFFFGNPEYFHNCYYWKDKIKFEILNPDQDLSWFTGQSVLGHVDLQSSNNRDSHLLRKKFIKAIKQARVRSFNLDSILVCPDCKADLSKSEDFYKCANDKCSLTFSARPVPDFNTSV